MRARRWLLLSVVAVGAVAAPPAPAGPPPTPLAFGRVAAGAVSDALQANVINSGSDPLTVRDPRVEGADPGDFPIDAKACAGVTLQPGETCSVTVTFAPVRVEVRRATLVIETNDPAGPLQFALSGRGTSPVGTAEGGAGTLPPPDFGNDVNLAVSAGEVEFSRAGASTFKPLARPEQVPVRTVVDASAGTVVLCAGVQGSDGVRCGSFSDGLFVVLDRAGQSPAVTDVVLAGGDFAPCVARARSGRVAASKRGQLGGRSIRRLIASAPAGFRVRGRMSSARAFGRSTWVVEDRCTGTLTLAASGSGISVHDDVRGLTKLVRARHSTFVRGPSAAR